MMEDVGIGYTLATGRLFCDWPTFQRWAEKLMGHPILTHEFGSWTLWVAMREEFERQKTLDNIPAPEVELPRTPSR